MRRFFRFSARTVRMVAELTALYLFRICPIAECSTQSCHFNVVCQQKKKEKEKDFNENDKIS